MAFSISTIDKLQGDALDAFWKDHARALASGGVAMQAISLYLGGELAPAIGRRLKLYRELPARHGLAFTTPPRDW